MTIDRSFRLLPIPPARSAQVDSAAPTSAPRSASTPGPQLREVPPADGGDDRTHGGRAERLVRAGAVAGPQLGGGARPRALTIQAAVGPGCANRPEDVRAIQARLQAHGFLHNVTGAFDAATRRAVERFQAHVGFHRPDGRIDPERRTLRALRMSPQALQLQLERSAAGAPPAARTAGPRASQAASPAYGSGPAPSAPSAPLAPGVTSTPPRQDRRVDPWSLAPQVPSIGRPRAAELSVSEAYRELEALGIPFERTRANNIEAAVRIRFPLRPIRPGIDGPDAAAVDFGYGENMVRRARGRVIDVRLAVLLAHLAIHARERGVVAVEHLGMYNPRRDPRYGHGRGLAIDISGFIRRLPNGSLERVTLSDHWGMARASNPMGDPSLTAAERRCMIPPTAAEVQAMSEQEHFLREMWGVLLHETALPPHERRPGFTSGGVVTPSHNRQHHNHFDVALPLGQP